MNDKRKLITVAVLLAFLSMLPVARASEEDEATKLTFNQTVQIPGRVLPAGTYWFTLLDTASSRNVIQIFNSDRSILYATVLAVSAERLNKTDHTEITFAQPESIQPETMLSWFYPGETFGHEFIYSQSEEKELAQVKHQTVMAAGPNKHQTPTMAAAAD